MRPRRLVLLLVLIALSTSACLPAEALVGAAPDQRFADRVAMVLMRRPGEAGFCSALVLNSRTVLTAAHCLRPVRDMAVAYRDASGAPSSFRWRRRSRIRTTARMRSGLGSKSIDVALVRTARPLDVRLVGARLPSSEGPAVGDPVILTGFGATREGDWKSGGALRAVTLAVREPASAVLVWAADPNGRLAGACSGNSGAPIWSADGETAVAIAAWAQAPNGRGCGGLTQGPRLAPLKSWIELGEADAFDSGWRAMN